MLLDYESYSRDPLQIICGNLPWHLPGGGLTRKNGYRPSHKCHAILGLYYG